MPEEMSFRFQTSKELMAAGWDDEKRPALSQMERGFCTAMDFDAESAMDGFLHPFIYWAVRLPEAVFFFETIEAREIASAINTALQAVVDRLGAPSEDDFGNRLWDLLQREPALDQQFEALDAAYNAAPDWMENFDAFLKRFEVDPVAFWKR